MEIKNKNVNPDKRQAPLEMSPDEFREAGHALVERIADFLGKLPHGPVTTGESPAMIRSVLGNQPLPKTGTPTLELIEQATQLLFDHSLFNGHPRFWGYITSSAAPIGALADMLAATVNPNVGGFALSPMATEIERQAIRWIAELIGFPVEGGGVLVSGGNMANFVGFLAARTAKAPWNVREEGVSAQQKKLVVYCSRATHTWIEKAADLFGPGTKAIRWIDTNADQQMEVMALEKQIAADQQAGCLPFLVVGAAGTVSTGTVDPLPAIAKVCRQYDLWFHVDGAYGAPAAVLPEASENLKRLDAADSVALDPHKWLYSPLEAGCVLVRNQKALLDTFSFHPEYYNFSGNADDPEVNFYEFGPQNSRGFRALKVWMALQQIGKEGYVQMIRDDIALSEALYALAREHPQLQAISQHLSITTFRFVPENLPTDSAEVEQYLNQLNQELLNRLQAGGEAFLSNAVIDGKYCLRACIVNFRTTLADIQALPEIIVRIGKQVDTEMRPASIKK